MPFSDPAKIQRVIKQVAVLRQSAAVPVSSFKSKARRVEKAIKTSQLQKLNKP